MREVVLLKIPTRSVALVAVFASLYYVLSLVSPYVPAVGLPLLQIKLEALMASVFGLVLGPYLGGAAALLGALLAWALPPTALNPYSTPFLLSPPLNAVVVGLVFYRKPKWASALFGTLIIAFLFLPPSQPLTQYYYVSAAVLWDKIIALLLILPIVLIGPKLAQAKSSTLHVKMFAFYLLLCFVGNQADNMWGSDIFAVPSVYTMFGLPDASAVRVLFILSPFVYPAIRLLQAIVAAVIAVPIMNAIRNTGWTISEKSIVDQ
jgi:hypothetical protein